ncbi:PREDICTED: scarecrow-like protein 18 [Nelumbo nucifera]|uniref:Scarecrow-like protein 18 n=2 Tax=Nelumbo nucifera TaxID=4432 RepID=A0A822Y248_NELNU|nr:PREDICTED: scarecrow-like protein 18 [Nelumbo nucifera]DAD23738.1 TPA_asm: hypothetical protein HUJ06_025201 [Nelumbo nucifera]
MQTSQSPLFVFFPFHHSDSSVQKPFLFILLILHHSVSLGFLNRTSLITSPLVFIFHSSPTTLLLLLSVLQQQQLEQQQSEMLSSFSTSHEEEEDPSDHHYHNQNPLASRRFTSAATHMRQLLINCAELVSQSNSPSAHRLLSFLSTNSSPYGDSTDRLVHQFTRALSYRLNRHTLHSFVSSAATATATATATVTAGASAMTPLSVADNTTITRPIICGGSCSGGGGAAADSEALQSSYLSLNQITPFIRFSHLTANQAILEAIEGHQSVHILDFDIMQGVQWPPLMQAIAERSDPSNPPPTIRITGTGQDLDALRRTGDRLQRFAHSLGLKFQFNPLLLNDPSSIALHLPPAIVLLPDEILAVNCVLFLHRLLRDDSRDARLFLRTIKAMNPKVVTVAEREANHNHPFFLQRFVDALDHYTALFDSLEATLPPNSRERLAVEQVWFGKEILDIVSADGDDRRQRHERFETWVEMLRSSGFSNVPLSPFALSQAKLLLRLHYPSEGYQLQILNDSLFLGWQNQPLFSVSSWN